MARVELSDIPGIFIADLDEPDPEFFGWPEGTYVLHPTGKLIVETTRAVAVGDVVVPAGFRARVWAGANPSAFNVHSVLPVDVDGRMVELPINALDVLTRFVGDQLCREPYPEWRRGKSWVARCPRCKADLGLDALPDCADRIQ